MSKRDWQQSFSSKVVTPRCLLAEQVSWADIPHALAQKVRFNGQLRELGYSVAQHCVLGAQSISGPFKLAFLLHEVSEVYLPDVPSPLKPFLHVSTDLGAITWEALEAQHANAIFQALGLSSIRQLIDSSEVKEVDVRMLMTEKRDLASEEPQPWGIDVAPMDFRIDRAWNMVEARDAFEATFRRLTCT